MVLFANEPNILVQRVQIIVLDPFKLLQSAVSDYQRLIQIFMAQINDFVKWISLE